MKNIWGWIAAAIAVLGIFGLCMYARPQRQAYSIARGAIENRTELSQERIDMAVEMATTSVDLALKLAGDLPSQQAKADLVKQDIEEIGNRLSEAADARGELAVEALDQSIERFNTTLETVEEAADEAENKVERAVYDRIYGVLIATRDQLVETVLNVGQ